MKLEKRVVITGAAGFLGSHLMESLNKLGIDVLGIDQLSTDHPSILSLDIRNGQAFTQAIQAFQPTHLIHLAALTSIAHSHVLPQAAVATNIESFVNVLEVCRTHPQIRLIYASSAAAKAPITNVYGATKQTNEALAAIYATVYGLTTIGMRYCTVYGPRGRPDMAYFQFTQSIAQGIPITLYNAPISRDLIEIDDAVKATIQALQIEEGNHLFEVGRGVSTPISEMVHILERLLGRKAQIQLAPLPRWDIVRTCADLESIQKKLNWQATVDPITGLSRFVHWWRQGHERPHLDVP